MGDGLKGVRVTITPFLDLFRTAPDVLAEIPIEISGDDEVELSIAVVIKECCTGRLAACTHAGSLGNILKRPIALVWYR